MWIRNEEGKKVFRLGRIAWEEAASVADRCLSFLPDDEDEWVADEIRSCYNCRFRRWTAQSFACLGS